MRYRKGYVSIWFATLTLLVILSLTSQEKVLAEDVYIKSVAVIAHSVSCSMMAREIRSEQGWSEIPPKKADFVLVVCRSMLFNPLRYSYDFYGELDEDADRQLNIAGSNYHIYIYQIHDDLSVSQVDHTSFEADF
jgi:hypothetical protein